MRKGNGGGPAAGGGLGRLEAAFWAQESMKLLLSLGPEERAQQGVFLAFQCVHRLGS